LVRGIRFRCFSESLNQELSRDAAFVQKEGPLSHPAYAQIGTPETKVMEECAELIQELCKVQRFGWFNWHPEDPMRVTNLERVKREMDDVLKACGKLDARLTQLAHDHYKSTDIV
jgi:NTP pyrophosphatase (non-canonical NTP hydrolase)